MSQINDRNYWSRSLEKVLSKKGEGEEAEADRWPRPGNPEDEWRWFIDIHRAGDTILSISRALSMSDDTNNKESEIFQYIQRLQILGYWNDITSIYVWVN